MDDHHHQGRHARSSTRTGAPGPAHRLPSRLAAERRRLGRPDAVLPAQGLSRHRARPARPWPFDADGDRQRDGHLRRRRRRARRARWTCRNADPRRPLDRRRRGRALCRAARQGPRRQGGADRRGAADHGEDRTSNPGGLPIEVFDGFRAAARRQPRAVLPRCRRAARSTASTARARRSRRASSTTGGARA